ncbi:unnamed protein product [Rotaria sp. Silwood2]|nr:unnamed protein product [Rotaria sp. Silwood2]
MGIDIIWLLPIHPIGISNRKGSLGSPYSIKDFRAIKPEYGRMDDFHRLVSEIHRLALFETHLRSTAISDSVDLIHRLEIYATSGHL